ncbi:TolC family protein [Flammeovirga kamogawensis]|uniref:TolC family protein n=1 Tax=Flammeovirga kamogawensis TaxID=373891 RepID=A0ABX8H4T0_9BACT|nr:TolC family protein [Flammeovirga kamogawensis]MBB6460399.1 outer membrane protein TolC [Flammeovirga kamogawensis]QWG10205.1 TolC family protein [Flammeovirga kamogawensis]TRX64657.1 TolC family protein [Flammeovirga kamogawensis]
MNRIFSYLLCILSLSLISNNFAQDIEEIKADSTVKKLTLDELYQMIMVYHPVAQQAELLSEQGQMQIRLGKGYFDPKLESKYDQKVFKNNEYYQKWNSYAKIPLWAGNINVGYERNDGYKLNPENDTDGGNGLMYIGLELPVLKGLLMDERRAAVKKSHAMQKLAEADQIKLINKLILQIAKDYWEWYYTYHQYRLALEGYELAQFRMESVDERIRQGDLATVDGVEAKITIQQREINLRMAQMDLQKARLVLSNHMWTDDGKPLELLPEILPEELKVEVLPSVEQLIVDANIAHPDIVGLQAKNAVLAIDQRMAKESVKPELNLKYNYLGTTPVSGWEYGLGENYKFGATFSMPLFLRKERAKLQMTKLKIQDNELSMIMKKREISNNIRRAFIAVENYVELTDMQQEMSVNYQILLQGEADKFEAGESTVFYMNVREGKLLEAETKLFKMKAEYAKSVAELNWTAGVPPVRP